MARKKSSTPRRRPRKAATTPASSPRKRSTARPVSTAAPGKQTVTSRRPSARPPRDIDDYIARFPDDVQAVLQQVRETIRAAAPDAEEVISYQMPAFRQQGIVVFFAAWSEHLGMYPPVRGDQALERAVAPYAGPKGNLQFPWTKPLPHALITRIVKHRVEQNLARAAARKKKGG